MVERTTGTVTFLFTDIEGSTRLLKELGAEAYAVVLDDHRRLLREAVARFGGHEIDTQGDAFFVAFARPRDAIGAAGEAQRALAGHAWPDGHELRVRMGIHTAEATATAEGYVGVGVHRGARICSAGHGGQVLVSHTTHDLLAEEDAGFAFVDLGAHRLKDLTEPQRLFGLVLDGLPDRFPPLRTLENRPTNLPVQSTPLVGRDREVAEVVELLRRPDVRVVTLTGPGGTGKTRLALQTAAELVEDFPHGVFFVTLAAITDPSLVVQQVAQTLGVNETAGQELTAYLTEKDLLLVIDNLEQVLNAAPLLVEQLAATSRVKLLATSREALRVAAERVYPVPPLGLPDPAHLPEPSALSQFEAVALFIERAKAVAPSFAVTDSNAPVLAEICVRLDGLPLAIELAAARVTVLSPEAMLRRLDESLDLLSGGRRDAPERHRTLAQTIAWSYDLLSDDERSLFARLGVFVGGFTLEAVERVCDADLDTLGALVDKSLVRRDGERFVMLETIRDYAQERLSASDEEAALRDRHADFFENRVSDAFGERFTREAELADELEADHDNVRAALDHLGATAPARQLRLAGMLGWFWHVHSHLSEGRARLAEALASATGPDEDRARALGAAGSLAGYQGDVTTARSLVDEAIEIWRSAGREQEVALALFDLGWAYFLDGDDSSARDCWEESLQLQRRLGNPALVNRAQLGLLQILVSQGELETVPSLAREAIELSRSLGDVWAEHFAHHFMADRALIEGDFEAAIASYALSLDAAARSGDEAETCYELQGVAMTLAGLGQAERALRIAGAADRQLRSLGIPNDESVAFWKALLDRFIGEARDVLGAEADAAWEAGRHLDLRAAVAEALSLARSRPT
jgi:predicted ATPase/class 3 adenylate cyclase